MFLIRYPEKGSDMDKHLIFTVVSMVLDVSYRYDNLRRGLIGVFDLSTYGFEHTIKVLNSQFLKFLTAGLVSSRLCFS